MAGPFDYTKSEIVAGGFLLTAVLLLGYLSISIGGFSLMPQDRYQLSARFSDVGDLKPGAPVKLAGVTVGKVDAIKLADYFGEVTLVVDRGLALPRDTIASIGTAGLLGDSYVSLSPGASEDNLADGGRISRTEPALNLADILGRYAFGAASEETGAGKPGESDPPAHETPAVPPRNSSDQEKPR